MRLTRISFKDITNLIQRYSLYQQSCLSIEQFTTFGKTAKPVESFQFGRHELPVRLAHIIREIDLLPKNLLKMPSVEFVRSWYVQSFRELLEFQEEDETEEVTNRFTQNLMSIKHRHDNVVETMAQGIMELRQQEGDDAFHPSIQYFLDRFYMSRISIRMLITQHLLLFGQDARSSKSNFIGCFDPNCHVISVVEDAVSNAAYLCEQVYCASPSVEISEVNAHDSKKPVQVAYIPGHLYHMLFELMKNAMRAVVEQTGENLNSPPIKILITKGKQDLTVKISDQGGGIPKCKIDQVFEYHYTSAREPLKTGGTAPMVRLVMGMACHCQDCTQNTLMEIWSFIPWKDMVQMLLSGLRRCRRKQVKFCHCTTEGQRKRMKRCDSLLNIVETGAPLNSMAMDINSFQHCMVK
ncbi:pyruvate dehydrogenase (acetyl-transferring) kinase isozyme 2, mitochondrial-like isoform X2 [Acropora millepora]|uniref:pyruvate dehydrogenase (acetyl-transferring) kinase isozyme 2, mitochondrial-like isoform X2 n=1 Tax=Acropora millepora TaxID=45264 RepID=UPI001CF1EDB5|nr:pyruvate dehydrogenase (acetyl-transferring) kinase isozyme 2, mitochondrial-like isoform X2 [Acropora millepora]